MPPKAKGSTAPPPASRDLVPVGPRAVFGKNAVRRDANGNKPTTARALVLRNGKYGARGTGEIMLLNKMSGREKLDLLAGLSFSSSRFALVGLIPIFLIVSDDLIESTKTALSTPFRLEKCLKIVESQYHGGWCVSRSQFSHYSKIRC